MNYSNPTYRVGITPEPVALDRRVCEFQHTFTHISEFNPNINMLTFDFSEARLYHLLHLLKMVLGLGVEPLWVDSGNVSAYSAWNFPGGGGG